MRRPHGRKNQERGKDLVNSCMTKRRFDTEEEAITTFASDPRYRPGIDVARAYFCVYCHKFHLTHG